MTHERLEIGRLAEQLVAARLETQGWHLVARNARTRQGELDIVALDTVTLVFVEVKAGRVDSKYGPERPVLAVGPRKQLQVRRLAAAFMAAERGLPRYEKIRFDAVGVVFDRDGTPLEVEHLEGAF